MSHLLDATFVLPLSFGKPVYSFVHPIPACDRESNKSTTRRMIKRQKGIGGI